MPKEEKKVITPRRGPGGFGGPGMRGGVPGEKAKDFKSAIKRLLKELSGHRVLISISLVLAMLGAVLSIIAPNQLSKLTDEITEGLVVNKANLEELTNTISQNLTESKMQEKLPDILQMDVSSESILKIMNDERFSLEEKSKFQSILQNMGTQKMSQEESFNQLLTLPEQMLRMVFPTSSYQGQEISSTDKIGLLKADKNSSDVSIPKSIQNVLLQEIQIDGVTITIEDQGQFLNVMSELKQEQEIDVNELYAKIDQMPESIQKVVKPFMDMDKIKAITFFLIGMYLCSAIFTYIESICMTNVANKFAKRLRSKISIKINCLPLKYFDRNSTGDILSRITNDVDTIAQSMNQSLSTLVSAITLFLGSIFMMFVTNWIMAITAILSSLIGFLGMILILKRSQKYFVTRQVELGHLNGHIEEIYSGLNVVKVYNGKKGADKAFDELNQKVCESNQKSQFLSGLMHPIMGFIGNFGYVAICIVGALLTMKEIISFGVIVAFISYVRLFTSPLSQIAQAMTSLQSTAAASERVFEFVDEEEMTSQEHLTQKLEKEKVEGKIEFENVVFQYDNNDKPTIHNFTATAKPGQKIAIVGPTGAGKTTMVNLLMKFYEINSGDIKIDGVSTKELTRENIHELFTMVLQDTWLFDGTIKENIVYNRKNISDERVREVCKEVGLDHYIRTLPHGYDSKLSENDSVSAGQRQLLTIARGMIEDSPFLILDEATSNVDTRTEELVQKAMDKLTEGKTSFIIAHRLSTIKNADMILVMKDGNIIEQGNHEELMEKNGAYAKLYNSQFEL